MVHGYKLKSMRFKPNGEVSRAPTTINPISTKRASPWVKPTALMANRLITAMAFCTVPAPLYPLYMARDGFSTFMVTIVFAVYALTGLCVGISATLLSGRLASASPVVGNLVELDAIAAVVIGGTALAGGKATVTGTFFGVITFALIFNLLNLLNMPSEIQGIVKGVLILAAVALQRRD